MVSIISLEHPLSPPVPIPFYLRGPDEMARRDDDQPDEMDPNVAAAVRESVAHYDQVFEAQGDSVAASQAAEYLNLDYDMINPALLDPYDGIKIWPYNARLRRGWIWTYATLLSYKGTKYNYNPRDKHVVDDDMIQCVSHMMAHSPADRITITALKTIVDRKTAHPDPGDVVADRHGDGQGRDADLYSDDYVGASLRMLFAGIPDQTQKMDIPGLQDAREESPDSDSEAAWWPDIDRSEYRPAAHNTKDWSWKR